MNSEQQYIDLYTQSSGIINAHSAPVMNALREQAFADFRRMGFPTRKVERYKYTDVAKLFEPDYGLNLNRLDIPVNPYDAFRCDVPNLSTSLYFVVNDSFYTRQLPQAHLPEGVIVDSLCRVAATQPQLVEPYYGRLAQTGADALVALNTMLAQDGLFIYVPRHVRMDRTVQIINILRSDVDLMVNRRVLIVVEQGAEARFLFCDHAADDRRFLATQVIEAYVGDNASLDLYCMEETHIRNTRTSNVFIEQQANSRVNHNVITLHNGTTVNRLDLTFRGEGAECCCNGCVIADKTQRVDNNTLIDHQVPHCTSNELYKYVLDGNAVEPSPDACSCATEPRRPPRRKPTRTSAPRVPPACTPSPCSKSMPTMSSAPMAAPSASSTMQPSSICASAASASTRHGCCSSSPLSMRLSTPSASNPSRTACTTS